VGGDVSVGGWLYLIIVRLRTSKHVNSCVFYSVLRSGLDSLLLGANTTDDVQREVLFVLYELMCNTKTCYAKDHIPSKLYILIRGRMIQEHGAVSAHTAATCFEMLLVRWCTSRHEELLVLIDFANENFPALTRLFSRMGKLSDHGRREQSQQPKHGGLGSSPMTRALLQEIEARDNSIVNNYMVLFGLNLT
jgi:hypothetical protein